MIPDVLCTGRSIDPVCLYSLEGVALLKSFSPIKYLCLQHQGQETIISEQ